jgi:nicotinamidase-related amidase
MNCGNSTAAAAAEIEIVVSSARGSVLLGATSPTSQKKKTESASGLHLKHDFGAAAVLDSRPAAPEDGGNCLLIIDPQNDFHEGGALAVPGATKDSQRIIDLLQKQGDLIDLIVVTLDTHHEMHIAHGSFWMNQDGSEPEPFTIIASSDIVAGTWTAKQPELRDWSLEYAKKLEAGGRFKLCIWPKHCLLGTEGHAVYAPLAIALNSWAARRSRAVTWVLKGQNNRTEMYSALKAEVEIADDSSTRLNDELVNLLSRHNKVICCGQALSHCVNYTVRDLQEAWPKARSAADIVILEDGTSPVPGFDVPAAQFLNDMRIAGLTICRAYDLQYLIYSSGETKNVRPSITSMGAAGVFDSRPLVDEVGNGSALLIIDPQNDFHEGGALAVPGAAKDSKRIIDLLNNQGGAIDRIVVTLDTHHEMHIAHSSFWVGTDGTEPAPFTTISAADISAGKWSAKQKELSKWSYEYAKQLEAGGRFKLCIWPTHCLLGTEGHAVYAPLAAALNSWAARRSRAITWVLKGQNNRTEMYSALKAEVEIPDDPSTRLNLELVSVLSRHSKIICCGQALSHCVNYTVRDLVSAWPKTRSPADIVVLSDGSSAVPGFEEAADQFNRDMSNAGVTFSLSEKAQGIVAQERGAQIVSRPTTSLAKRRIIVIGILVMSAFSVIMFTLPFIRTQAETMSSKTCANPNLGPQPYDPNTQKCCAQDTENSYVCSINQVCKDSIFSV